MLIGQLTELADERVTSADLEWAVYDHAASEAMTLCGSCAAMSDEEPAVAALVLRHAIKMLPSLPVPTGLEWVDGVGWVGVFRRRLWAEIAVLDLPAPALQAVHEVLLAA